MSIKSYVEDFFDGPLLFRMDFFSATLSVGS